MVADLVGMLIGALIAGAVMARRQKRSSAVRALTFEKGTPVKLPASLRGESRPFPKRWRAGALLVGAGNPLWTPRFSLRRPVVEVRGPVQIERVRKVSGMRETWSVNPECQVIHGRSQGKPFELAVLATDLQVAREALGRATS